MSDVRNLFLGAGIINSDKVFEVMNSVDRAKYTNPRQAYIDAPQGIGYGVTISAPHMVYIFYKSICMENSFS